MARANFDFNFVEVVKVDCGMSRNYSRNSNSKDLSDFRGADGGFWELVVRGLAGGEVCRFAVGWRQIYHTIWSFERTQLRDTTTSVTRYVLHVFDFQDASLLSGRRACDAVRGIALCLDAARGDRSG